MYLRNSTLLPVAWKLNGLDNLGDDFSVSVTNGVIDPLNEFGLQLHFRAVKPVNVKKVLRLEVSDSNSVLGLSHAENISIQAEAYDVALDMSFPKGKEDHFSCSPYVRFCSAQINKYLLFTPPVMKRGGGTLVGDTFSPTKWQSLRKV